MGLTALLVGGVTAPAFACYTGLVLVPTADTAGAYTWVIDIQAQGRGSTFRHAFMVFNTEYGIGDRVEIGVDVVLNNEVEQQVLLNAKVVALKSEKHRFALAVGFGNMDTSFTVSPYLVATKDFGFLRAHAGIMHDRNTNLHNKNHPFIGFDKTLKNGVLLMADFTAGADNFSSFGVGWMITPSLGVNLGAQFSNSGGKPMAVFHVVWTGHFRRP